MISKDLQIWSVLLNFFAAFLMAPSLLGRKNLNSLKFFLDQFTSKGRPFLKNFLKFEKVSVDDESDCELITRLKFILFEFVFHIPTILVVMIVFMIGIGLLYCLDPYISFLKAFLINSFPMYLAKFFLYSYCILLEVPLFILGTIFLISIVPKVERFVLKSLVFFIRVISRHKIQAILIKVGLFVFVLANSLTILAIYIV